MNRYVLAVLVAVLCVAVPIWGQTVSVALVEDAGGSEAPDLSTALLSGCLDPLFAEGFIATNETIGRLTRVDFQLTSLGIKSAREGYVDFIALVWIRYADTTEDPPVRYPETLAWRLMRVQDGTTLAEGAEKPERFVSGTIDERRERLSKLGRALANIWMQTLRKERG